MGGAWVCNAKEGQGLRRYRKLGGYGFLVSWQMGSTVGESSRNWRLHQAELVVRSGGEPDSKTPVLGETESPSLLDKEGVGSPGQEQKSQGRPEFLVVWRRGISGFLDRNHTWDPEKHIAEKIQSIGDSRDWGAAHKIAKIRSGYRTESGSRFCGGVLGEVEGPRRD